VKVQAIAAPERPVKEAAPEKLVRPDPAGRYGKFGGKYVPETLIPALAELEVAYKEAQNDPSFQVPPPCSQSCSCLFSITPINHISSHPLSLFAG
jgi:hypothetical protein